MKYIKWDKNFASYLIANKVLNTQSSSIKFSSVSYQQCLSKLAMFVSRFSDFKLKAWHLSHKRPEVFLMSQWQRKAKSISYLIYRFLLALSFIGILTYSITNSVVEGDFGYWFIYLTNNGLFICTITTTFAFFLVMFYHFNWMQLETKSISYKIYWLLSNISVVLALVISIVYWLLLFEWDLYFKGKFVLIIYKVI